MLTLRRIAVLALGTLAMFVGPAIAAEPKCPLDLTTCLNMYNTMHERPWLGINVDQDSTGARIIQSVVPGGPADKAGIKAGDVLEKVNGKDPATWFAGKGGWKDGNPDAPGMTAQVRRGDRNVRLSVERRAIPEDVFARAIGTHMIEGHLAHMHTESEKH